MSSTYGEKIKISVFGESHGGGIGVVIDGLPAGEAIDFDAVLAQMARRAPGRDKTATPRKESDLPRVLSGMLGDVLTGAPLCAVIENTNTRSQDYGDLLAKPRPGHSDYTAYIKYHGANEPFAVSFWSAGAFKSPRTSKASAAYTTSRLTLLRFPPR